MLSKLCDATKSTQLLNSATFPDGGGSFFPLNSIYPAGKSHDTRGIYICFIYPGGKTPYECFQAEKGVVAAGETVWGGGTSVASVNMPRKVVCLYSKDDEPHSGAY